ncbi:MAG: sigma-70 family RNA polymerase sigma factor [Elainellaceae cyanobacterium]
MARRLPNASDTDLMRRLKKEQPEALATLYDRYGQLVYTIALRILDNAAEAEDVTQEVFLSVWKDQRFDATRGALSSYLGILARSRSINRLNSRNSRQRAVERFQNMTPMLFAAPTPLEQVSQQEQEQVMQHAFSQLTKMQQQILTLNYYEGLSQSQIAQRLNIPLGTVKTHARQGILKLRQLLQDQLG